MVLLSDQEYYNKLDNILLSSLEYLRQVFKNKWMEAEGDIWIDDEAHVKKFIEGVGKNAYKIAQSAQKKMIKEKSVAEWDMSLLSLVIQNFVCEKKHEHENLALRQLKNIRNYLAHNGSNKVSEVEYLKNVEKFRNSIHTLGMDKRIIEKIIDKAGVTSSLKALEYMKKLHTKAKQFLNDGQNDKANECFSEAINVPSLLPINVGTAYEKRAEYYLSQVKDPLTDMEKCSSALLDVSRAIDLNEFSWMAHYLAAQCYRWKNELSQALVHYEKALAISPAQEKVKSDCDTCKVLAGRQSRQDHLNPRMMPMNLEERVAHLEHETGVKMSKQDFLRFNVKIGEVIKGQDHVSRGHQHFSGWDVPQNFTEAARHYSKAAKVKNPEGMYNLGLCYHYGNGVKQDVKEALRIYREVAEMDKNTLGQQTSLKCNSGVAGAQHALGMMYDQGIGVDRDYIVAATWYKKAMENGVAQAANNLGILYSKGQGRPCDEKMAELCWKQAINLNDVNAPASLMMYYMDQMEPDKALNMLQIGRELGNTSLQKMPDVEFRRQVEEVKSDRLMLEPKVIEFEQTNNLLAKGLTFKERLDRKTNFLHPQMSKLEKILDQSLKNYKGEIKTWGGKVQQLDMEKYFAINENALQGSVTARRILETIFLSFELDDLVDTYTGANEILAWDIIKHLYKIVTLEFHLNRISNVSKLKYIVGKLFEDKCDSVGKEDMMIRLCYAVFNLGRSIKSEDMYVIEVLKEGIRRYPNNAHYYDHLVNFFGLKEKFKEGLLYAEKGLKEFPDNVDLLYAYAVLLGKEVSPQSGDSELAISAYKKFLSVAPIDHRKVPEAYYQISNLIIIGNLSEKPDTVTVEQMKAYFHCGQEAEEKQLPCYLPYGESEVKCIVETLVTMMDSTQLPRKATKIAVDEDLKDILKRKVYLKSPTRKGVIQLHRQSLHNFIQDEEKRKKSKMVKVLNTAPPKLRQTVAKRMSQVKPIVLLEMNPTEDRIYENRVLDLTIIDEANTILASIHLVAEDENGDVTRLYIYNVGRDKETVDKFQPGCRVAIINPYMRIGAQDITNGIRNDEPKCIIFLEKMESMCRFCGEENALSKCSKCKRPYCSRECQMLDWKELNHKLICPLKFK